MAKITSNLGGIELQNASSTVIENGRFGSGPKGLTQDDLDMARMGKKPVLKVLSSYETLGTSKYSWLSSETLASYQF